MVTAQGRLLEETITLNLQDLKLKKKLVFAFRHLCLEHVNKRRCDVCKSKTMSVTNLQLFVVLYCYRSAHSALHKWNTQPILMQFQITVPPQQLNSKILQTQLHKGGEKQSYSKENLKFRDRTAKPKDHVTQETMKYIKIISIGGKDTTVGLKRNYMCLFFIFQNLKINILVYQNLLRGCLK